MAYSAQDFIRALKAPSDPPHPDGPTKLEIAIKTWTNQSVHVPNKDETIVEWILTRLLKEKDTSSILDIHIWTLLDDVLQTSVKSTTAARPLRTWLLPILSRIPSSPILIAFLSSVESHTPDLLNVGSRALAVIWPLAAPKISADALLDCYAVVAGLIAHRFWKTCDESTRTIVQRLVDLVLASYRSSLGNSGTKKKLYQHFIQHSFENWLQASALREEEATLSATLAEVYEAGIDTVLNVDILRLAQENFLEDVLRKAIAACPSAVISCLPRLFQSYLEAINKHRNTLFSQSSNRGSGASQEQVRSSGVRFFTCCNAVLDDVQDKQDAWRVKATLLEIIEERRLFGSNDSAGTESLIAIAEQAYELLSSPKADTRSAEADAALSTLVIIIRIDYETVASVLPHVLKVMVTRPLSRKLSCAMLDHVIDYNTKLRSADAVIELLLSACSTHTFDRLNTFSSDVHATAVSSALLDHAFLAKLSGFVLAFTTPGQVSKLVEHALRYIRAASAPLEDQDAFPSASDESPGPRKKRKTEKRSLSESSSLERSAVSFSLTSAVASAVLTSLPLHLLHSDARQVIVKSIQWYYKETQTALKSITKRIRSIGCTDTWSYQSIAASVLRLRYALGSDRKLQLVTDIDTKAIQKAIPLLETEALLPHLRIEILRMWLLDVEKGRSEPGAVFEEVLLHLERWLPGPRLSWAGDLCSLYAETDQHESAALPILYMLLDRWLPLFNGLAKPDQNRRLVKLISVLQAQGPIDQNETQPCLNLQIVIHRALHNAAFWEMHNIRDALLAHLSDQTEVIDQVDVEEVLDASRQGVSITVPTGLRSSVIESFGLLMSTPIEYLSRKSRSDLLRRAYAADVALSVSAGRLEDVQCVTLLRGFSRRMYAFLGSVEQACSIDYLDILTDSFHGGDQRPHNFTAVTLEIVKLHLSSVVKLASKGDDAVLLQAIGSFRRSPALNAPLGQAHSGSLRVQALVYLIDLLSTEYKATNFRESLLGHLEVLRGHLASWLLPQMIVLTSHEHKLTVPNHLSFLQVWHRLLLLSSWLSSHAEYPSFGRQLTSRLLAFAKDGDTHAAETFVTILSIVQAELHSHRSSAGEVDLSPVIATYLTFSSFCRHTGRAEMDDCLTKMCRSFSLSVFQSTLDLVHDGLSSPGLSETNVSDLVHVTDVLMRSAPEGSLKVLQAHLSRCLSVFSDRIAFGNGYSLREHILTFMSSQFNDRSAMIRQQDLCSIWSILGACLTGSTEHHLSTAKTTFTDIVSVLSAIIRLRRDLVSTTLPQLGLILRRLFFALRRLRPQLGRKQTRIVADTLPAWINPAEPARVEDSRALARLLTTLTTKTIVRTYGSSAEGQKAESLARPFSKHAAYVLCAYIDALNDPLCVMPANTRKELEPGLFALCDMMGEHNRDAMMVASLDAGGKIVMKGIWKEYEKQKYVGRG